MVGVLDLDSLFVGGFEEVDQTGLESIVHFLETSCIWEDTYQQ